VGAILGVTAIVQPIPVNPSVLTEELPAVLVLSIAVWPLSRTTWKIQRWEGILLLGLYLLLTILLVRP